MKTIICFGLLCGALGALPVRAQVGGAFDLNWNTFDGGGGTSTGGVYAVSGTIGQPDAGGPMTGGNYSLTAGFWSLFAVQTPGAPRLSVERQGANIRVFWPSPATGFVLDQTTALASPPAAVAWSQVPFPYSTNAAHISLIVPTPTGPKFYRLRQP